MLPFVFNPIGILFTLAAGFGVVLHDTRLDKAATTALAVPIAVVSYGLADAGLKMNDAHIHTERVNVGENLRNLNYSVPKLQPRTEEDRRYVAAKKYHTSGSDVDYQWPSI